MILAANPALVAGLPNDTIGMGVLAGVICLAAGTIVYLRLRRRVTPEELERRRRASIHQNGKIGDGEVLDLDGDNILYSYTVAGVGYTVSQDISAVAANLPADRMAILGPVAIKFLPRNPTNSIVISEDWSGLRRTPHPPRAA